MSGLLKVLVPIKRVLDYRVKVRVKADKSDVDLTNVKMAMNPFDEIAVEEAIALREKGLVSEVVVVTIGDSTCQETLRVALAIGADRAIIKQTDSKIKLYPLQIAKILKAVVEEEKPDLIIMGKQSIDGDNNQTGQMLAGLLNWPQGTFISKLEVVAGQPHIFVIRGVDGGLQTIKLTLPALVTTDLRLNTPRYASLPNIMKAKSKPLAVQEINSDSIKDYLNNMPEILEVAPPFVREQGIKVANVDELIEKLHSVEKLI